MCRGVRNIFDKKQLKQCNPPKSVLSIIGLRFGNLVVIEFAGTNPKTRSNMIDTILTDVKKFKDKIAELKSVSPDFPKIYEEDLGREYFFSTMVLWQHGDILFKRHHVESCSRSPMYSLERWEEVKNATKKRIVESCNLTIQYAVPSPFDDVVKQNPI